MGLLKSIMQEFASKDGVRALILADRAGFVIEKCGISIPDQVGPMIATAASVADTFISDIRRGDPGLVVVEADDGFMAIMSVTNYEILAVIADAKNLGKVLYMLKHQRPAIQEALM